MSTETATQSQAAIVGAGFEAFAKGDIEGFRAMFHENATWNHRNDDHLGGIHEGQDAIIAFVVESGKLTDGTIRAEPEWMVGDGQGRVVVAMRVTGTRPDGRSFDDSQIVVFGVDRDRVRTVDQYIGDPAAVRAFWA